MPLAHGTARHGAGAWSLPSRRSWPTCLTIRLSIRRSRRFIAFAAVAMQQAYAWPDGGKAIMLSPWWHVDETLHVCEGLETALALYGAA